MMEFYPKAFSGKQILDQQEQIWVNVGIAGTIFWVMKLLFIDTF